MTKSQICSCGGKLKQTTVKQINLEPIFGIHGILKGSFSGLLCDACQLETFDGRVFLRILVAVTKSVLTQERILQGEEARFLRKAVLGMTQARLAEQMGINSVTIADWERGERSLSKEHDYELRGIAFSALVVRIGTHLTQDLQVVMTEVFRKPRMVKPPKRAHRYVISIAA